MTIEEKAQAYDEALEKAKIEINTKGIGETVNLCEQLFPELRETEDERIRRKMIEHFKAKTKETWCNMPVKDIIAYLEKQEIFSKNGEGCYYYHADGSYTFIGSLGFGPIEDIKLNGERPKTENKSVSVDLPGACPCVEKQKETLHISETCKENADSFTEDERIRKALIDGVRQIRCKNGITQEQMIAYLEKQKETGIQWFKSDNVKNPDKPYIDKVGMFYTTDGRMCYASEIEKQKEQKRYWKPTETDIALFNKAVTTNKALTPAERAQLDIIRSKFSCCRAVNCSGIVQKEQKPDVEICPHSIKSKSYKENGYPIEDCDYGLEIAYDILEKTFGEVRGYQTDDGIREHQTAIKAVKDAMKEQKPDTRDADDLQPLGFIYVLLNEIEWKDNWAMSEDECLRRLNNYRPQKPVSISCAHENDAECIEDSVKFEEGFKAGRESGLRDGQKYVLNNLDSYGLCKPAEWSEEDKVMLNSIIWGVHMKSIIKPLYEMDERSKYKKYEDFLKALPERFNLQPKQEWSEEDADILNCCISSIEEAKENRYAYKETDGNTSYDREIDWLKSLRPQYHGDVTMTEAYKMGFEAGKASSWKPSEEQMAALEAATVRYQSTGLKSLYEDLKKLM